MRTQFILALALTSSFAVGCGGDLTSGTGQMGRLRYTLYTDYEVPQSNLTAAHIVTQHKQTIDVALTTKGTGDANNKAGGITHRANPSDGVVIESSGGTELEPPNFDITVASAGTVTIESVLDGNVFDKIALTFATPVSFDLILKTRAPYSQDFVDEPTGSSTIACEEGTQVTIDSAPLDSNNQRLAGMMETSAEFNPHWMAVPGVGVLESTENGGVWTTRGQANFYMVEPGTATLTVSDAVTGASKDGTFNVTPISHSH